MKIFTNKNLIQKLIIIFVCIFLLEFCIMPTKVQAKGGKLFAPIKLFVTAIGDIMASTAQLLITGKWIPATDDNTGEVVGDAGKDFWKKKIDFPIIQISPELIFANKIELLNVDFISRADDDHEYIIEDDDHIIKDLRIIISSWYVTLRTIAIIGSLSVLLYIGIRIMMSSTAGSKSKYKQMLTDWVIAFCILLFMHYIMAATVNIVNKIDELLADATDVTVGIDLQGKYGNVVYNPEKAYETAADEEFEEATGHKNITWGEIQDEGKISFYDTYSTGEPRNTIGLVTAATGYGSIHPLTMDTEELEGRSRKMTFSYNPAYFDEDYIRNHSDEILGTLTIILNFDESDYIESGSATVSPSNCTLFTNVDAINNYLNGTSGGSDIAMSEVTPTVGTSKHGNLNTINFSDGDTAFISKYSTQGSDGSKILYFINYARLYVNAENTYTAFGYLILYIILIVFVVMFTLRYMKRVIYVAFLTLIAPLVALTYPIDKLKDGKAQAFNMWFREYIFNVMIQPFHLLIYTILVGSALSFASQYMIYAIIAMGFIIPAENLLRSFFGFDKAGTLTAAGSFAGGALFSTLINKINKSKSGGSRGSGGSNGGYESQGVRKPSTEIKMKSPKDIIFDMYGQAPTSSTQGQSQSQNQGQTAGVLPVGVPTPIMPDDDNIPTTGGNGGTTGNTSPTVTETSSSMPSSIKGLTDPVFKPGDKWRIARGYERQEDGTWKKTGIGLGSRLGNAAQSAAYLPAKTLLDKAKTLPKTGGRLIRKIAIGGTVGGGLGAIGLAVGAASGDPSKAAQLAVAGAAAGYYGANHYGDKIAKAVGKDFQSTKVAFWGANIKQIEQDKFDKEFLSSPKNIDMLTRALRYKRKSKKGHKKWTRTSFLK